MEIEYTEDLVRKTAVVPRADVNEKLMGFIRACIRINSFKEVVPRMNDIFIKLVTEEE